jgi:hypothetical protein
MAEHLILEPTAIVYLHRRDPSGAANTTAAFADLVCSDQELLRAEFDAIVTANFPDSDDGTQRRRPPRAVATRTHRVAARGAAAPALHGFDRGGDTGGQRPQARQRGPPVVRHDTPPDNQRTIAQTEPSRRQDEEVVKRLTRRSQGRRAATRAAIATPTGRPYPHPAPAFDAPPTAPTPAGHRHATLKTAHHEYRPHTSTT